MTNNRASNDNFPNNTDNQNANVIGIEDRVFPMSFGVIKVSGFWKPTTFKMPLDVCYEIYTAFCFISIIMLMATIIVDNAISEKSIRSLIENLYLILTIANGISKLSNVYLRRNKVIGILKRIMEDRWSVLRDEEEAKIIEESIYSER